MEIKNNSISSHMGKPCIDKKQQYIVCMLGARMHYAVPRLLYKHGCLALFLTDFYSGCGWPRIMDILPDILKPALIKRMIGRNPRDVPSEKIRSFNGLGINYLWHRQRCKSLSDLNYCFLWVNRKFCEKVCTSDWGSAHGVFTFNGAGLEILQKAKAKGLVTIMEQTIAPYKVESNLLREEYELHPNWQVIESDDVGNILAQREFDEWSLADKIICGSDFVKSGISECGGPVDRCIVVPYGFETNNSLEIFRKSRLIKKRATRSLRVLTVGSVNLRKGSPYVLKAAKMLKGLAEFRMVGHIEVLPEVRKILSQNLELIGSVPRCELEHHYKWADIFLLPSLCEGSATATYEALAYGLPVVCTPNTGSVIRDGIDGFIVPIRNVDQIVHRIERLAKDSELLVNMSERAIENAKNNDLDAYEKRLINALGTEMR